MPQATCIEEGCERPTVARGLCDCHWRKWRKSLTDEEWEAVRSRPLPEDERKRRRVESSARWKAANPDQAAELQARWLAANPEYHSRWRTENADRLREQRRAWAAANREAKNAAWRRWAERHPRDPAKMSAKSTQWAKANPARANARTARHRARRIGAAVSDFTDAQWRELLAEHDQSCFYCGATGVTLEREHMIPLSRGGNHTKSNIVPSCGPCNRRKAGKTADEFQSHSDFDGT